MKSTLRKFITFNLAVMMAAGVVGCSSQSAETANQDNNTTVNETSSTTGTEGTELEPVTLSITWWGGQSRHEYTQELLDLYTELNPHVTFEATPSGWDGYFDKLATNAAAGTMPDIIQMDYLYISTYANNNTVADLQPYIDNGTIDVSNIDPVLYNSGIVNDTMAGMVLSSTTLAMAYNEQIFEDLGMPAPEPDWTWNDLAEMSIEIYEQTGIYGYVYLMADDTNAFNYYVRQNGYPLFSEDQTSLGYDDDQIYIDYVNMISELVEIGAMPNPDQYVALNAKGDEASALVTGEGAMNLSWANYGVRLADYTDDVKLITPPYSDSGEKGLWVKPGQFFSIAETSQNKEEAAKFIDWFINSEEANDIIMAERGTPVSSEIREGLINSGELTETQIEMFEYTNLAIEHSSDAPAPDPTGISEVNDAFQSTVYSVLYNQRTAEEAAAAFRQSADEILRRNNQ